MASPHVAGVAALVIDAQGSHRRGNASLDPDTVRSILLGTATDHACPAGGIEIYTDEGRPPAWNAVVRRDDGRQRALRRGHRQRHGRGPAPTDRH